MRIYKLLKTREDISILRMTVNEFRDILGSNDSHECFLQLKAHII